jgi:hypothetical protein
VFGGDEVQRCFSALDLGFEVGPVAAVGACAVGVVCEAEALDAEVGDGFGGDDEGGIGCGGGGYYFEGINGRARCAGADTFCGGGFVARTGGG